MKIIRRSFGTQYAPLELEDGDYYHLPLESKYIPHEGPTLWIPSASDATYSVFISCPHCQIIHDSHQYKLTEPHHLKEL